MSNTAKALVTLCALVAIYAGCCREWWIADSWIVTTICALGMGTKSEVEALTLPPRRN